MFRKTVMLRWLFALLAAALLPFSEPASAQSNEDYPKQTIRLIVGFAPGGSNDILARLIAERLQERFKQSVIVENKPGGGGTTAAAFVAREPADGYTLLIGASGAMAIAPVLYTNLTYDTLKDFSPISMLASFPLVMVVSASSPFKTVQDFVSWSKANPENANYATASPTFTVSTELFKMKSGAKMQPIPYRGSNASVASVLGGQTITTLCDTLPAMPHIQAGKLRALAITSNKRVPELPDVPTMGEAGVSDMTIAFWTGLFAKKGTPQPILDKLEKEVRVIMKEPKVVKRLRTLVTDAEGSSSEEFSSTIKVNLERWSGVAKSANIQVK